MALTQLFGAGLSKLKDFEPRDLYRIPAQIGTRALESVAGLPANVANLTSLLAGKILPDSSEMGPDLIGMLTKPAETWARTPFRGDPTWLRENVTKKLTGKALEPKSYMEDFFGKVVGDVAALSTGGMKAVPAIVKSLSGNAAHDMAKAFGVSDNVALGLQIGTMVATDLPKGISAMKKLAEENYKLQNRYLGIGKGQYTSIEPLKETLGTMKKIVKGGIKADPGKSYLKKYINAIEEKTTAKGLIPVKELLNLNKDINRNIYGRPELTGIKRMIFRLQKDIKTTINDYGASKNPTFYKHYRVANRLWSAMASKSAIQEAIKGKGIMKKVSFPTKLILGTAGAISKPELIPATMAVYGVGYVEKFVRRIMKSPEARNIYKDIIVNSAKQSAPVILANVDKLDTFMRKEFPITGLKGFTFHPMLRKGKSDNVTKFKKLGFTFHPLK